jgi:hypothetical protein
MERTELDAGTLSESGCVALLTPHSAYDLKFIAAHAKLVFDARNSFGDDRPSNVIPL